MEGFAPIFIPGPSDAPGNTGGGGGLEGAILGTALTPVLGPLAPIAGSLFGGLFGGGKPKGSNDGLLGAFNSGLGSLFGSKSSAVANQSVSTTQATSVNVENVLGGRKFGNYDSETGDFDTFQAIADVFQIKSAQDMTLGPTSTTQAPQTQEQAKKPINFTPLIVVGGLAAVFILMRRK